MHTKTPDNPIAIDAEVVELGDMTPAAPGQGMNRSTDQVSRDMRAYVDAGAISEEDHALLVWLFVHGKERGLSFEGVSKLVGYSSATVSRIFAGKYSGSMEDVVDAVRGYRHLVAEREKMSNDKFIETSVWTKVRAVCDLALTRSSPVRIVGPSQIGKTHSMLEYKRRARFNVFYCRVPAAPTFRNFMEAIAEACAVNVSLRTDELRRRIPGALNRQTLLMVDELHELALSAGKGTAMKCMEWLREVWDHSRCGLVVCGTRSMEDDLINGAGLKGWLDQFDQRCIRKLALPNALPADDVALAAQAYGFPAPDASATALLVGLRMNRLCACLNMAATAARKRGLEKTWELFKTTYKMNFGGL